MQSLHAPGFNRNVMLDSTVSTLILIPVNWSTRGTVDCWEDASLSSSSYEVEKRELSEKYSQGTRLGKKKDKKLKSKTKSHAGVNQRWGLMNFLRGWATMWYLDEKQSSQDTKKLSEHDIPMKTEWFKRFLQYKDKIKLFTCTRLSSCQNMPHVRCSTRPFWLSVLSKGTHFPLWSYNTTSNAFFFIIAEGT